MWKTAVAGLTALSIAGSGLAVAQSAPPADSQRARPTAEDIAAITDARIAALRAGLRLSAQQEKHWPAVEAAMRDLAKQRADRIAARRDAQSPEQPATRPDAVERLRRGAEAMTARGSALQKLADAVEPLYQSLDDGQKRRFAMLLRMGRGGGPHHGWRHRG